MREITLAETELCSICEFDTRRVTRLGLHSFASRGNDKTFGLAVRHKRTSFFQRSLEKGLARILHKLTRALACLLIDMKDFAQSVV